MTLAPASLLQLIWLASPALPVGGYSYSEGLEAPNEAGSVHDEASASSWLIDQLHLALGRSELPLLAQAIAAWVAHDAARPAQRWPRHHQERPACDQQDREADTRRMRPLHASKRPYVMTNLRTGDGLAAVVRFIETRGLLA